MLVVIANHGVKNRAYLEVVLDRYRRMRHEVTLVVLSDAPKDLGPDVEVLVGAPTDDPWSLPFAHRPVFADRVDDHDLFVYSEDDTLVEEAHLEAFLRAAPDLPEDRLTGFMRYEVHENGERSYCSIHSTYRWDPGSVVRYGDDVYASFSNAHAAFYVVTQDQLRRAIASGGFLVPPHAGAYDMLVSAATDVYTRCGFHRVLPVNRLDDVLVHHLPNVYLGKLGITEEEFRAQQQALLDIADGRAPTDELLEPTSRLATSHWDVPQHPRASSELRQALNGVRSLLSVGCTSGAMERELVGPSGTVVGVPVDAVVAAVARSHGVRTTAPRWDALDGLGGERFDAVLLHEVLHHVPDPVAVLHRVAAVAGPGTRVVVTAPNVSYQRLRALTRRSSAPPVPRRGYDADGMHPVSAPLLRRWARDAGLQLTQVRHARSRGVARLGRFVPRVADRWLGAGITAVGTFDPDPRDREPVPPTAVPSTLEDARGGPPRGGSSPHPGRRT